MQNIIKIVRLLLAAVSINGLKALTMLVISIQAKHFSEIFERKTEFQIFNGHDVICDINESQKMKTATRTLRKVWVG